MMEIYNTDCIKIADISVLPYKQFYMQVDNLLFYKHNHCVNYFAVPQGDGFLSICCIANDSNHKIYIVAHNEVDNLEALTAKHYAMHVFEREMHENYGITFDDHPWLKPVRYPANRYNRDECIENYPFYSIDSDDLHEVGVGPIHAGIIEPGHFRFICNGEKVLHLEIMLGYQHRGIESLMLAKKHQLQRAVLAESISGDTAIGHSLTYTSIMESLSGKSLPDRIQLERIIALELERIAIHIGDTSALCLDIAYQLGQVACEALRTIVINTTQAWCGNRFGKGFIRLAGTHYPLTADMAELILKNINDVERRYREVTDLMFNLPSVLSRFEGIGEVTVKQAELVGLTGMAARMAGVNRDIRASHPFLYYRNLKFEPVVLDTGDVMARALLRRDEVFQSIQIVRDLLEKHRVLQNESIPKPDYQLSLQANSLCISLIEGWRGEICHVALTDETGEVYHYKIKDPSLHNWMGLALAVRNQEISDFPICNKSFNLSYCGHDL
ncbi:MAG: NADH-quinone oxidoreductase subunit C [Prevotellaceae bacterium]|jgi:Ni,Fe-hydrogenase III large subunit|nr:NADH-quinone oxidoreductase subunit C [Prevotellaceae bacterium]